MDDERLRRRPTWVGVEKRAHEPHGERRGDHRAAAEAHDRQAGRHAGPVGKPLDQRRDGRDVAEAEPDAAEDAVAEIDEPELVRGDAEAPTRKPPPKHSAAANIAVRGPPSSSQRPNTAAEAPRKTMAMLKIQPSSVSFQSSGADFGDADQPGQRQVEDAEGVDLADAQMDAQRGRRHQPAAEPRFRDGMLRSRIDMTLIERFLPQMLFNGMHMHHPPSARTRSRFRADATADYDVHRWRHARRPT